MTTLVFVGRFLGIGMSLTGMEIVLIAKDLQALVHQTKGGGGER